MAEKNFFKQKTLGITLIVCASLVLVLTLVLKLWWNENVIGYSSMLPAKETIAYVEMPEQLTPIVIEKIKEELDLDWNAKVLPMLEGPVALALVKTEKFMAAINRAPVASQVARTADLLNKTKDYLGAASSIPLPPKQSMLKAGMQSIPYLLRKLQ